MSAPSGWRASVPRGTHPVTPLVRIAKLAPVVAVLGMLYGPDAVNQPAPLLVLPVLVAAAVVSGGLGWLQWTRFRFWFDVDGDLRIRSGVLIVNERRVQVSRLQSVDVTQPLLARLFGLASVRPEVAGTGDRQTRIEYLTLDDAVRLRAELLARAAGVHAGDATNAPEAWGRPVLTVPALMLLESLVLRPVTVGAVLAALAVLMSAVATGHWATLVSSFFVLMSPLAVVGGQFLTLFGFTVATSPDGVRLRFGLTEHRAQTVPPGRVQAVRFQAPLLWRHRGWVRIEVNVAGATGGEDAKQRPSVLLPVAPRDVATAVLREVLPESDPFKVELFPVPGRAKWRAPLQGRRLAAGADADVFVVRHGWLVPTWDVVPHARTQSVRVTQGPWQRRLRLASVHVDSTPGPVRIEAAHRSAEDGRALADAQADRARAARATSRPDRWMLPQEDR